MSAKPVAVSSRTWSPLATSSRRSPIPTRRPSIRSTASSGRTSSTSRPRVAPERERARDLGRRGATAASRAAPRREHDDGDGGARSPRPRRGLRRIASPPRASPATPSAGVGSRAARGPCGTRRRGGGAIVAQQHLALVELLERRRRGRAVERERVVTLPGVAEQLVDAGDGAAVLEAFGEQREHELRRRGRDRPRGRSSGKRVVDDAVDHFADAHRIGLVRPLVVQVVDQALADRLGVERLPRRQSEDRSRPRRRRSASGPAPAAGSALTASSRSR